MKTHTLTYAEERAALTRHGRAQHVSLALRDFLVDRRVALSALLLICLVARSVLLSLPHQALGARSTVAAALGYVLVLVGVALRSWAAGVLPKGRGLATTGPYRLCRHPLYLGSVVALAGFAVLALDALGSVVLVLFLVLVYVSTIQREEQRLPGKFGAAEWAAYRAATPCLLGWRFPTEFGSWSLRQWLRSREYRALLSALAGLIVVALWLRYAPATLTAPALAGSPGQKQTAAHSLECAADPVFPYR